MLFWHFSSLDLSIRNERLAQILKTSINPIPPKNDHNNSILYNFLFVRSIDNQNTY